MKEYLMIAACFVMINGQAQLQDDFSDGNFTFNPSWSGSVEHFKVNTSLQLQLNDTGAGTSWLSTSLALSSPDSMVWQTYVRQSFSASANNYGRVYLMSDEQDLSTSLHGYFLQFGESGANDAVELFRQDGTTTRSVCRAKNGAIATAFALRVAVTRDISGKWGLGIDYAGGTNYVTEATGQDTTYAAGSYFGVVCVYTSSNSSKFYYDDVMVGPPQQSVGSSASVSVKATSVNSVDITFSEAMEASSAETISNYTVTPDIGNPETAKISADQKTVSIVFENEFQNSVSYQLTLSGIRDAAGNLIAGTNVLFSFIRSMTAVYKDVIITEIFADPIPSIGLPAHEYLELFNRNADPVDLTGWKVSDGTTTGTLTSVVLLSGHYLVITSSSGVVDFAAFPNTLGVQGFPSLNNDGDAITLKNEGGVLIDSVNYSLRYYHDPDKQNGGWAMELIDLTNLCGEEDNWTASDDPRGGSPGIVNSVNASKPDVTGPKAVRVIIKDANIIAIVFDEALDSHAPGNARIAILPELEISQSLFSDVSLRTIELKFATPLDSGVLYSVEIQNVTDCSGNSLQQDFSNLVFAIPQRADSLDVLINEVLFNPRPSGVDFVEVYNRSEKFIDLRDWKLANFGNNLATNISNVTADDFNIAPHSYTVFTMDTVLLKNNYPSGRSQNFFAMPLPSLPDDEGSIAMLDDHGRVIDYFFYTAAMHTKLLQNPEGVSLERISFSAPTNEAQNWRSASAQCGFATPGYLNSAARPDSMQSIAAVSIDPVVIVPGSGAYEFAKINYRFGSSGYVGNVVIIDQQGRVMRTVGNNETLGTEGFFRWDGDRDDGSKVRIGYYAVVFQVFDLDGNTRTFRKRVIVAAR